MQIDVLAECMLEKFEPKKPTLAIRIFNSNRKKNAILPLDHKNYIKEFRYFFDDISLLGKDTLKGYKVFDGYLAKEIIEDFERGYRKNGGVNLMIHCLHGLSRSPAIAIGLNELFKLGNDFLIMEFSGFNRYVYKTLIEKGRKLNLG